MSEYVVVTNIGDCYPNICHNSDVNKVNLCCDAGIWVKGALPENGKPYKTICENENPVDPRKTVFTIEDEDTGQRYVIGSGGLAPVGTIVQSSSEYDPWHDRSYEYKTIKKEPVVKQKEKPTIMNENIKVGDLVIIKKSGDNHNGELMKVTHLNAYNYDYAVCYPHQNVAQYGYNKGQVVKYIPEPDLPEDQKPAFSRSELIEILEQNKPAEEILLDIRDHITN